LSPDFQLFVLAPLLVYPLWRFGRKILITLPLLASASVFFIFISSYEFGFTLEMNELVLPLNQVNCFDVFPSRFQISIHLKALQQHHLSVVLFSTFPLSLWHAIGLRSPKQEFDIENSKPDKDQLVVFVNWHTFWPHDWNFRLSIGRSFAIKSDSINDNGGESSRLVIGNCMDYSGV
jgi:hypothetical protein